MRYRLPHAGVGATLACRGRFAGCMPMCICQSSNRGQQCREPVAPACLSSNLTPPPSLLRAKCRRPNICGSFATHLCSARTRSYCGFIASNTSSIGERNFIGLTLRPCLRPTDGAIPSIAHPEWRNTMRALRSSLKYMVQ